MANVTVAPEGDELDGNLALLGYCLLLGSILFAGLPGLVAVIIAYVQREVAGPTARAHFNFQIQIFWVALILTVVAALSALGALAVGVSQLVDLGMNSRWDAWDTIAFDVDDVHIDTSIVILLGMTAASIVAATLWLIVTPLIGLVRLASERRMGDRAA